MVEHLPSPSEHKALSSISSTAKTKQQKPKKKKKKKKTHTGKKLTKEGRKKFKVQDLKTII
jgi:hypothetical protein